MNTKLSISLILLCSSLPVLNAQTAPAAPVSTTSCIIPAKPKGYNKGHFVFGTNLFNYTNTVFTDKDFSNSVPNDSIKNSFSNFSFSLNIWGGYFISDKVCVGLNFNETYGNSAPVGSAYTYYSNFENYGIFSALVPANFFFRYYIIGDTGIVNVFVEGIVGASYSSGTYVLYFEQGSSQAQTLPTTETALNGDINVALSLNASKHFAFQFKAGFVFNTQDYNYAAGTITSGGTTSPTQASEATFTSVGFIGTLGLQYKL